MKNKPEKQEYTRWCLLSLACFFLLNLNYHACMHLCVCVCFLPCFGSCESWLDGIMQGHRLSVNVNCSYKPCTYNKPGLTDWQLVQLCHCRENGPKLSPRLFPDIIHNKINRGCGVSNTHKRSVSCPLPPVSFLALNRQKISWFNFSVVLLYVAWKRGLPQKFACFV